MRHILASILLLIFFSCQTDSIDNQGSAQENDDSIVITWELIKNEPDAEGNPLQIAQFTIHNTGTDILNGNWVLYFNQISGPITGASLTGGAKLEHINGDFFRLIPSEKFKPLRPNDKAVIKYKGHNWAIKNSDAPAGLYLVFRDETGKEGQPILVENYKILPFGRAEQLNRMPADKFPIPTSEYRYAQNTKLTELESAALLPLVPTPLEVSRGKGTLIIDDSYTICYPDGLGKEADYLQTHFESIGLKIKKQKGGNCFEQSISLIDNPNFNNGKDSEAYKLMIEKDKRQIKIEANAPVGVFYGIQSLKALIPNEYLRGENDLLEIPVINIEDAPRFSYRGLHFDVARNFHGKETVKKLLSLMATYKLNKFHFHITDDEGWRLQIAGLPELTEIGARRGHTLTEKTHLQPAYGSGPFTKNSNSTGSGFYTAGDYKEIIQYAQQLHIEVIPEIDLPGHARAAIKAMEGRYRKLLSEGKEAAASAYLLSDLEDESVYSSAQVYDDNVICVCKESVYTFIEKVVDELIMLHQEANVPLNIIHTGGDEVPVGAWEKSPVCATFIRNNPTVKGDKIGLTNYFIDRFGKILQERGLITGGWEEIALTIDVDEEGHHISKVNPQFLNNNFQPYVWNAVFGWGGEDIAYQLANAGYPVVLCNASNLYFDLSYGKDPADAGLYWAGFVDTRKVYEFVPYDLFKTATMGKFGESLDPVELSKGKKKLSLEAQKNILGIQGELWSETFINNERLEYSTYPKLLGLAERAWAVQPDWAIMESQQDRMKALEKDWNQFANTLGQKELNRLDYINGGVKYRIPPPGAKIEDGKLFANIAFPGLLIRYTVDGSEPTEKSSLYDQPFEIVGDVKLKAFSKGGNTSHTVLIKKDLAN